MNDPMQRNRIVFSLGLFILALPIAVSGVLFYPGGHEITVPIDRSVLEQKKPKPQIAVQQSDSLENISHRSAALKPVPDPRLIETTGFGLLPRIAETGDRSADIYARLYEHNSAPKDLPRLSLVLFLSLIHI